MKLLRNLFYSLSPELRFFARKLYYFPSDLFTKKSEMEPPKGIIYTGSGDFIKQGKLWREYFIENGLEPNHNFLDIGSGIGRIAIGLTNFTKGNYEGFDAIELGVKWCNENITSKYPNFNFKHIRLFNDLYNSKGLDAARYTFEYNADSFHFAASISVFTHMIDAETFNYLRETHRVLKPGGILVSTFFIMNDDTQRFLVKNSGGFDFKYEYDNYFLMDKAVKSANVCYKEKYLISNIEQTGFTVVNYIPGYWCGRPKMSNLAFQDILILKKK